ncbi:hypothetical protein [Clostridium massiliodielmoense]|uniref:hypothetical protein n=1 Tax=Clostridium massiliodielmoense TaxID=1776385 RepID=UPI000A270DA9|nr:hypothetical protein [Clostridium massiliodielmoense]
MPKPSIFSNNYDKQMKRRRRIIIMIIVAIVIVLGVIVSGAFKKLSSRNKSSNKENINKNVETNESKKADDTKKVIPNKDQNNNKNYTVKLSNGTEIKLLYNIVNNEKEYIKVEPKDIKYTISPSKKYICLVEKETQKMILFDTNGNQKDITKNEYVSTSGQSFTKDNILESNPNYIWCENPIFLNDDNIIYISQLPWFNKADTKYVWKYTISNNNYINNFDSVGEISGKDIQYGNLTQDGLEITVDGVEKKLTISK